MGGQNPVALPAFSKPFGAVDIGSCRLLRALARCVRRIRRLACRLPENKRNDSISYKENNMLWTIFVILLVLWFLGLVTSYTLGGFVHILLVLAVIVLVFQLISGRRAI
jgi:hypothetical protein